MHHNHNANMVTIFAICLILVVTILTTAQSAPTITSITPNIGINTGSVNITNLAGTGFLAGATVKLVKTGEADITATDVTVVSSSKITCSFGLSGKNTGDWDVVVTNSDATPPTPPVFTASAANLSATLTNGFKITYPAPTVTSITPNSEVNTGSVSITNLAGTGFMSDATVKLTKTGQSDIAATSVVVVSSTKITCTFALTGKIAGTWNVVVTNSDAQSGTLANGFTITYPAPTVTGITPGSGINTGSTSITNLAGSGFLAGATVKLTKSGQSDIIATGVTVVSATKITCSLSLADKATGTWNVVVTNTDSQSGTLTNGFTINYPAPTVTSITPNSGVNSGSISITNLAGSGFLSGATVKLTKTGETDIIATSVSVVSSTKITCSFNLASKTTGAWNIVVTNSDSQSGTLTNGFIIPPTVTIDRAVGQADPTKTSPINFTVVFSESVTGFTTGDVTLSGTAGATTGTVSGSGTTYTVAVSGMTGSGTVVATINAGVAKSSATNADNVASTSLTNTVNYDNTRPTVTVNQASGQADPTTSSSINFTAVFSESVTGFTSSGVSITGTAGATTATITGSGTTYNIAISGMSATGTVILSIIDGAAHDSAANTNTVSSSTDATVNYITPLTASVAKASGQLDPASLSPINFTVTFNRSVANFATGDVTISGSAGATTAIVTGSGTTYQVAVSGMTTSGTVVVALAAGVAADSNGINNLASNSVQVTLDSSAPTVTINQAAEQADPTNASTVMFTAVFSKAVSDFTKDDVTVSGTANATTVAVTNPDADNMVYTVTVSGMTSEGTVIVTIPANAAYDIISNGNTASTSTDNTVTYDTTAPTLTITAPTTDSSCTRNSRNISPAGTISGSDVASVTWSSVKSGSGVCVFSNSSGTWSVNDLQIDTSGDTLTITATDTSNNTSTDTLQITVVDSMPGTAWQGMSMVSLPIIPDVSDPKVVVGFAGNSWAIYSIVDSRYFIYPEVETYFNPTSSAIGKGYWTKFAVGATPAPCGIIPDQTIGTTIKLSPGWNMIGQPYIKPIIWNTTNIQVKVNNITKTLALASAESLIDDYALGYNPTTGSYYLVYDPTLVTEATGTMAPWEGFWIKAYVDCDLILPAP